MSESVVNLQRRSMPGLGLIRGNIVNSGFEVLIKRRISVGAQR